MRYCNILDNPHFLKLFHLFHNHTGIFYLLHPTLPEYFLLSYPYTVSFPSSFKKLSIVSTPWYNQGCLSFIRFHIKIWKPVTHHWTFWTVLFKPPGFHIKTTKTCWPTYNRQFFERTEILFLGSFPRNCCNSSFWNSQEVGELPDLWNKVLCHLVRLILPLNGFLF